MTRVVNTDRPPLYSRPGADVTPVRSDRGVGTWYLLAMPSVAENIQETREAIGEAARRAGRSPEEIRLMGVTKNQEREAVEAALSAGLSLFGENRVQEAEAKYGALDGAYELHLIGHLQRNKAKRVPGLFSWVQSIDAPRTANAVERACAEAEEAPESGYDGTPLGILLEVNISGEEQKYGVSTDSQLKELLDLLAEAPHLECRGLMGIAPWVNEEARIRGAFAELRERYERVRDEHREMRIDTLSMGMSGDFPIAIEEGANLVRIGTALFGSRGY